MAIDLGQWKWAANLALDLGVPVLGAAFGIPGQVSEFAANALKRGLGLPVTASAEETKAAAQADPATAQAAFNAASSEVTAKYQWLTEVARVAGDVAKTNVTEINATIRQESNSANIRWWHWRHLIGYVVLLYALEQIALIAYSAVGKGIPASQLAEIFNASALLTGGLLGLLGFVAYDNTSRVNTALTGTRPEGAIASVVKAVRGK